MSESVRYHEGGATSEEEAKHNLEYDEKGTHGRTDLFDGHYLLALIMHCFIYSSKTSCSEFLQEGVLASRVTAGYRVWLICTRFRFSLLWNRGKRRGSCQCSVLHVVNILRSTGSL